VAPRRGRNDPSGSRVSASRVRFVQQALRPGPDLGERYGARPLETCLYQGTSRGRATERFPGLFIFPTGGAPTGTQAPMSQGWRAGLQNRLAGFNSLGACHCLRSSIGSSAGFVNRRLSVQGRPEALRLSCGRRLAGGSRLAMPETRVRIPLAAPRSTGTLTVRIPRRPVKPSPFGQLGSSPSGPNRFTARVRGELFHNRIAVTAGWRAGRRRGVPALVRARSRGGPLSSHASVAQR
jgi:hypothetical protein